MSFQGWKRDRKILGYSNIRIDIVFGRLGVLADHIRLDALSDLAVILLCNQFTREVTDVLHTSD